MPATAKKRKAKRLHERAMSPPGRVDREAGVIFGVKIIGLKSKNGRRYTEAALRRAASLYEGVRVHVDHGKPGDHRSIATKFGVLRSVRYDESKKGLFADLHYLKRHPAADQIAEAAERFPQSFGLSHDAEGHVSNFGGESVINEIRTVNSVDIVDRPATVSGLFESLPEMKELDGSDDDPQPTAEDLANELKDLLMRSNGPAEQLLALVKDYIRKVLSCADGWELPESVDDYGERLFRSARLGSHGGTTDYEALKYAADLRERVERSRHVGAGPNLKLPRSSSLQEASWRRPTESIPVRYEDYARRIRCYR